MNTLEDRRSVLTNAGSQEVVFLKKKDIENVKTNKQTKPTTKTTAFQCARRGGKRYPCTSLAFILLLRGLKITCKKCSKKGTC